MTDFLVVNIKDYQNNNKKHSKLEWERHHFRFVARLAKIVARFSA
jgi:hypothetical protein